MLARSRYLLLPFLLGQMVCFGCVGDIEVPEEEATPVTNVTVSGLQNSQLLDVSYAEVTITDPTRKYSAFQYSLDTDKNTYYGNFGTPLVITVSTEGSHVLNVKGLYANGLADSVMAIPFTVSTVKRTGSGRYRGDSLRYFNNYSSMSVEFVTYSGARTVGKVEGRLVIGDSREFGISGVSIDNQQTPADVEVLLTGIGATESMRASGEGYYNYLNLKYVGVNAFNANILGDIKLYREDVEKTLIADCSTMRAYSQSGLPDIRSIVTLYSFDNRYFYGHIRLINTALKKILTYDVKGDAGAKGLTEENNGMPLALSKPFGYLVRPTPAAPTAGTGYILIALDAEGNYKVSQLSVNLPSYAIYDAISDTVRTVKSYRRR